MKTISLIAGLFLLTLIAYWNSFHVPFVFDDMATIQQHEGVRFGQYAWNLLASRSVLYLTFVLNAQWFGLDVWGYHVVNFILHFINGVLLFFIARKVLPDALSSAAAFMSAAFFLVHPIQTESVTYISSRSELLSTCFYLVGLAFFMLWPWQRSFLLALAILPVYLLGLGSKETVITLPVLLVLVHLGLKIRAKISFHFLYAIAAACCTYFVLTHTSVKGALASGTSLAYLLTQIRVIVRYLELVLLPIGLNLDYDLRLSSQIDLAVLLSGSLLIALLALAWWLRNAAPIATFAIGWFFITLAPTSSFVPLPDVIFEHRMYLPMVGLSLLFPVVIEKLCSTARWRYAVIAVLTIATILRNQVWIHEVL